MRRSSNSGSKSSAGGSDLSGSPAFRVWHSGSALGRKRKILPGFGLGLLSSAGMLDTLPATIAAQLDPAQRDIILSGPISFSEADELPEGLFDYDLSRDRGTGEETHLWTETDLGRQVREVLLAQR